MDPIKKKSTDILLVRVPEFFLSDESIPVEKQTHGAVMVPLGILHLGSYVRHKFLDVDVHYLDLHLKCKSAHEKGSSSVSAFDIMKKELKDALEKKQPSIVGVTCSFNAFASNFNWVIAQIKHLKPDCILVVGGHYISSYVDSLPENKDVDYIFVGEGEIPFTDFIRRYKEGALPKEKIINRKEYLKDMDSFPPLDYDRIGLDKYLECEMTSIGGNQPRSINIMTARGCPHRCIYCATHNVWDYGFRMQSASNMFRQVKELKNKYNVQTILFVDDHFLGNKSRIREFCQLMIEHHVDINWYPTSIRINSLDEEIICLMRKAGCKSILLAVESASPRIQKMIKKGVNLGHAKRMVECFKREGFRVYAQYIFGFPGENIDEVKQTIEFARELRIDWNMFGIATPLYGTEMYRIVEENGYLMPNLNVGSFGVGNITTKEFTSEEIENLMQEANYKINFLENYNYVNGKYDKALPIFESIARSYPEHFICKYMIWDILKATRRNEDAQKMYVDLKDLYQRKREYYENLIKRYNLHIDFDEKLV